MKAAVFCALALVLSVSPTERYDRPHAGREMDKLCATLVTWQRTMKAEGHPDSAYAGTGMERHCPAMV